MQLLLERSLDRLTEERYGGGGNLMSKRAGPIDSTWCATCGLDHAGLAWPQTGRRWRGFDGLLQHEEADARDKHDERRRPTADEHGARHGEVSP